MRRRSTSVRLQVLAAVAAATISGCSSSASYTQTGRCVDQSGKVLPDSACEGGNSAYAYPHWIYGGSVYNRRSGGRMLTGPGELGGYVRGGSSSPGAGATVVSPSGTVVRGGFGGSGESGRGGGESGGEGHGGGGAGE